MENVLLEACREIHGLAKRQVAHKLGIPTPQYYELEKAKLAMTPDLAKALERLYGIKFHHFLESSRLQELLRAQNETIKKQKDEIKRLNREMETYP
jgi:plasmid maintenance system antidote protein VapI